MNIAIRPDLTDTFVSNIARIKLGRRRSLVDISNQEQGFPSRHRVMKPSMPHFLLDC